MKLRERLGFFSVLLLLFFLGGCGKERVAKIGDAAPDFTLPALDGREITLNQYHGKNIFLLFWTQGCVFCQTRGIFMVNEIYRQGQQSGLVVLSIDVAESKGEVAEFVRQKGLVYPVLMDKDASVSRIKYGVYVVPTLLIIGRDGLIKEKVYGYLTEQALLDFVEPYLKRRD